MNMGYTVWHMTKGKVAGGLGHHIDRTEGKEHTYPHADKNKIHLNKEISIHKDKDMFQAINEIIENRKENEGLDKPKTVRKDAVRFVESIFSGSNSDMKSIEKNQKIDDWFQDNYDFACKEFGEENIVRFSMHLDEETPHIHCVSVPITDDGKLSAKKVMGNPIEMRKKQDRYADAMKKWGLERGVSGSNRKHDDRDSYMKRVRNAEKAIDNLEQKEWGILNKKETINALKGALKASMMEIERQRQLLDQEKGKEKKRVMHMQDSFRKVEKTLEEYKGERDLAKKANGKYAELLQQEKDKTYQVVKRYIDRAGELTQEDVKELMPEAVNRILEDVKREEEQQRKLDNPNKGIGV